MKKDSLITVSLTDDEHKLVCRLVNASIRALEEELGSHILEDYSSGIGDAHANIRVLEKLRISLNSGEHN